MERHTGGGSGTAPRRGTDRRAARRAPRGRRLTRRLARADLRAVSEVRHALRALLDDTDRSACADTAELLTSELVTNALVHTAHDAVVTATVGPQGVRVEVRDFTGHRPRPRTPVPDEHTGGRGLGLVQSLADSWGVRALGVGKVVWFQLDDPAGRGEAEGAPEADGDTENGGAPPS
ncbi:ATP-binding protein [Streptomyces sp. NPDC049954]|uniref:ATP-binding protein n=1 Tax=Streptomyces sp. NPDC049954 TaxID=3155779 RepID=UPI00343B4393